jgi:hypothetical protein
MDHHINEGRASSRPEDSERNTPSEVADHESNHERSGKRGERDISASAGNKLSEPAKPQEKVDEQPQSCGRYDACFDP